LNDPQIPDARIKLSPFMTGASWVAMTGSTVVTVSHPVEAFAADGFGTRDILLTVLIGAAFLMTLLALHEVGTRILPRLTGETFKKCLLAWCAIVAIVIPISLLTGLMAIGVPVAKNAEIRQAVVNAQEEGASASALVRTIENLTKTAGTKADEAATMAANEYCCGTVSGNGGGRGETFNALVGIATTLKGAESALNRAKASTRPLVRRIERHTEKLRELADRSDLKPSEVVLETKRQIAELNHLVEEVRRAAPIASMRALVDGLSADWESMGLNARATGIIRETFNPTVQQFDEALVLFEAHASKPPAQYVEKFGFALLADHIPDILPVVAFLLLIDGLPLLHVFLVLTMSRRNARGGSGDHRPDDPARPNGAIHANGALPPLPNHA